MIGLNKCRVEPQLLRTGRKKIHRRMDLVPSELNANSVAGAVVYLACACRIFCIGDTPEEKPRRLHSSKYAISITDEMDSVINKWHGPTWSS